MKGFEPPTPSLPWKCSTPELHWLVSFGVTVGVRVTLHTIFTRQAQPNSYIRLVNWLNTSKKIAFP